VKRWLVQILLPVLLIAGVVHMAAVWAVPRVVMHYVLRGAARRAPVNAVFHAPQVTARDRAIPLPSPDLLYSTCVLNLSAGPMAVSVQPGADYLSLAVFDAATDNVFVTNDRAAGGPIRLLIVGPDATAPNVPAGATLVRVPTQKGFLLLRALGATAELRQRNEVARRSLRCEEAR
jgi:uncharacterized membrane protein